MIRLKILPSTSNALPVTSKAGKVEDASKLGNRTYFRENEDAKVSLTPDTANAPGGVAKGVSLVTGVYNDPTKLETGKQAYGITGVEAIEASGVNGSVSFANLEGVTGIINPKGTLDVKVGGELQIDGLRDNAIKGGAGKDVFVYTAGNDAIADYATGDKISLGAAVKRTIVSGSDVVLTVGSNTLTVKDGKNKKLGGSGNDTLTGDWTASYVAADKAIYFRVNSAYRSVTLKEFTATTFNVNGNTYANSGTKPVRTSND